MKPFTVTIDEKRMGDLDKLLTAAGSRLGDGGLMMLSAQTISWLVQAAQDGQQAHAPHVVDDAKAG